MGDGPGSATGKWIFANKKLTYTIEQIEGKPADPELKKFASKGVDTSPYFSSDAERAQFIAEKTDLARISHYVLSDDGKTMSVEGQEPGVNNTLTKAEDN